PRFADPAGEDARQRLRELGHGSRRLCLRGRAGAERLRSAARDLADGAGAESADATQGRLRMEQRRHSLLLAVCCTAQFMVILDVAIVNVALPSIRASLGFSAIHLQWIVNAYTIAFAGFLMLGGCAADLFGRRRTFITGLLLFSFASLLWWAGGRLESFVGCA